MRAFQRAKHADLMAGRVSFEQSFGYSATHLTKLVELGIRVRAGSSLTNADLNLLREAHPYVSPQVVLEKVRAVNAMPKHDRFNAFVEQIVAPGGEQTAIELIDQYERFSAVDAIDRARDAAEDKPGGASLALLHSNRKAEDPLSVRALIKRQMAPDLRGLDAGDVLEHGARAVERQVVQAKMNMVKGTDDDRSADVRAAFEAERAIDTGMEMGALPEGTMLTDE